jgi:hypothetical protein
MPRKKPTAAELKEIRELATKLHKKYPASTIKTWSIWKDDKWKK